MIFHPPNPFLFREKALHWAQNFSTYMYLNGNNYSTLESSFPEILAVGVKNIISHNDHTFNELQKFRDSFPDSWLFGYISYDTKNELEKLSSRNENRLQFQDMYFFEPEIIIHFQENKVIIESDNINPNKLYNEIFAYHISDTSSLPELNFRQCLNQNDYLDIAEIIKKHIVEGDIYELNYCLQFYAMEATINSYSAYKSLNTLSPAPFSLLLENETHSIISSSPERFLKRAGDRIISQPMKGTIRRGANDDEDIKLIKQLKSSEKEIAENMMITDLVRNDLSKSCIPGTVKVEDLFGVYTFPQVHQMITTISGDILPGISDIEVIKNAFPMGSMTGAPKIRAMELIDTYENFYRGPFSGAAGYFGPHGHFDLNVLIRTLFYNKSLKNLSFSVGSAITHDCDPKKEYEECLLKGETLMKLFNKK